MCKIKSRDEIVNFLEKSINDESPYGKILSFNEISTKVLSKNISRQAVSTLLQRLMKEFVLISIKLTPPRMDTKDLIKEVYLEKKWPERSSYVYVYTVKSKELYTKLNQRYSDNGKNKELINQICKFYRKIEIGSMFQYMYAEKNKFVPNSKKDSLTKDIASFYKKRKEIVKLTLHLENLDAPEEHKIWIRREWEKFLQKNITMDKFMHCVAFFEKKNSEIYNPETSLLKTVTEPMYSNLLKLFAKVLVKNKRC